MSEWLRGSALPLWADAGVDARAGGFVERLDMAGAPILSVPKRVRVQARQIYVYAHASLLGLYPDALGIATQGYDFLMRHACPGGVDAGFVHAVDRHGQVVDERRDSYDHAFLLFAFSTLYRATGRSDVRAVLDGLLHAIDRLLRHTSGEGYADDWGLGSARSQNPHMHLLEAMLAAYEATAAPVFLYRADELAALFAGRMYDTSSGVLREHYDAAWRPAAGDRGDLVEPGHHAEWVWLLQWYARVKGQALSAEALRLHEFAQRHGRCGGGVLLCDELRADGTVRKASTRSWPQTEAIKSEIAVAEAQGRSVDVRVHAIVRALFDRFLDRPVRGAWIDWIDADGAPLVDFVPASTFYHLFLGFSEYLRIDPERT